MLDNNLRQVIKKILKTYLNIGGFSNLKTEGGAIVTGYVSISLCVPKDLSNR